jgi:hypothetical protein
MNPKFDPAPAIKLAENEATRRNCEVYAHE